MCACVCMCMCVELACCAVVLLAVACRLWACMKLPLQMMPHVCSLEPLIWGTNSAATC
jgi:hypothetical protein